MPHTLLDFNFEISDLISTAVKSLFSSSFIEWLTLCGLKDTSSSVVSSGSPSFWKCFLKHSREILEMVCLLSIILFRMFQYSFGLLDLRFFSFLLKYNTVRFFDWVNSSRFEAPCNTPLSGAGLMFLVTIARSVPFMCIFFSPKGSHIIYFWKALDFLNHLSLILASFLVLVMLFFFFFFLLLFFTLNFKTWKFLEFAHLQFQSIKDIIPTY